MPQRVLAGMRTGISFSLFFSLLTSTAALPAQTLEAGGGVEQLHQWSGADPRSNYGSVILGIPDVDGDGTPDLAISELGTATIAASVEIRSGATGQQIWVLSRGGISFGSSLACLPDVDGDGVPELAIGAPMAFEVSTASSPGAVWVYSLGTGQPLFSHFGATDQGRTGDSLVLADDLDGDGLADFLAGSPGAVLRNGPMVLARGLVSAISSATGLEIWASWGPLDRTRFGTTVAALGDVDGDGIGDFAVGSPEDDVAGLVDAGSIQLLSGRTGASSLLVGGRAAQQRIGRRLAGGGDFNGDGIGDLITGGDIYSGATGELLWLLPEFALGINGEGQALWLDDWDADGFPEFLLMDGIPGWSQELLDGPGAVVLSGREQRKLLSWDGLGWLHDGRIGVARIPDLDGDGRDELAIGARFGGFGTSAEVEVLGFRPFLEPSASSIGVAQGGAAVLELAFPADAGGDFYRLLASASGTGPSMVGSVSVPLTVDAMLLHYLLGRYPSELYRGSGRLDPAGGGHALFAAGPGQLPAGLIGHSFHYAAVCGPLDGQWRYSSVAHRMEILP